MLDKIKFILEKGADWIVAKLTINANHDYPYHDSYSKQNEEEGWSEYVYVVGSGNTALQGDQHKMFVSKRMIIALSDPSAYIRLNHRNNVLIHPPIPATDAITPLTWFTIELHTNIRQVFISLPTNQFVNIYCEGVLPEQARDAE